MFQRVEPVHPSLHYAYDFPNIQFPRNVTPKVMTDYCWAVGTAASGAAVERHCVWLLARFSAVTTSTSVSPGTF
jgi:hypothetical protein